MDPNDDMNLNDRETHKKNQTQYINDLLKNPTMILAQCDSDCTILPKVLGIGPVKVLFCRIIYSSCVK